MRDIQVGVAQFEPRDRDKEYNLDRIRTLTRTAAEKGAELVSFHECAIPGYTFLMTLSRERLWAMAEEVPGGPSVEALRGIAAEYEIVVAAGLLERDGEKLYNTYAVVSPEGFVAKHRKLHPFIHQGLAPGEGFTVFDLLDCRWGILICYDNNLPENVRATTLLGAEIVLMPHVTCGTQSPMPGRGRIPRSVWDNRARDPVRCRQEFRGPKGRAWLLRWLPCRLFENGIYGVFSNAVGIDHDTVKPGCSMLIDPFGEILVESSALGDDVIVGLLTAEKAALSSGNRYLRARRPDLYGKLVEPRAAGDEPVVLPGWTLERNEE